MAEEKAPSYVRGWIKAGITSVMGLCSGAVLMYVSPLVTTVIKPGKPLANFSEHVDGLTVTFQNRATGASDGWWDFGDGSPLEPFATSQDTITHTYPNTGNYNVKLSCAISSVKKTSAPSRSTSAKLQAPIRLLKPSKLIRSNPMPPHRLPSKSRPGSRTPICASGLWAIIAPSTSAATPPPTRSVTLPFGSPAPTPSAWSPSAMASKRWRKPLPF